MILKIKSWEKDIKKLTDKSKKENDPISKSLLSTKVVCLKYFVQELNSILSLNSNTNKDGKNDKTM